MDLTKRNLWTYTLGGIGRDAAGSLFSSFLMAYVLYTKTLTPAQFTWVSMLMVAARIFNGCIDPVMGNILEVTRTKWGKFKPWIAAGMVGSAAVFVVSFGNRVEGGVPYVVLFGAMYFLYSIVFTMNDIAYWGMVPALASQKGDRDLLTSRTILFAGIGSGIAYVLVPPLTTGSLAIGGSAVTGYTALAVIFSAFFIGMQVITLAGVKERPLPPRGAATVNRVSFATVVNTMRGNDQLLWVMLIYLLSTVANGVIGGGLGSTYIYFTFGYEGSLYTIFSALGAVASAAVMVFYKGISKRMKRDRIMRIAIYSIVAGYAAILLVGLAAPAGMFKFALLMLCNLFAMGGQNVYYLVMMICIANTVEYNEWKTGARAEGIIFSVRPFLTKLGFAVIQFVTWLVYLAVGVLHFTNKIAATERAASVEKMDPNVKAAAIKNILEGVPAGKGAALIACMALIPVALYVVSYGMYRRKFILDEETYDRMLAEIGERNAQEN